MASVCIKLYQYVQLLLLASMFLYKYETVEAAVIFKISVNVRCSVHWSLELFVTVCFICIKFVDHTFSEFKIFGILCSSFKPGSPPGYNLEIKEWRNHHILQ